MVPWHKRGIGSFTLLSLSKKNHWIQNSHHLLIIDPHISGDTVALRKICNEGIFSAFRARIHSRPKNETHRWILHKYIGSPRIVSTRMGRLPMDKSAIMQVVVKINSIQSLEKIIKGAGRKDHVGGQFAGGEKKKLIEYLVLQRMLIEGEEQPWMIWGTVQETPVDEALGKVGEARVPAAT